MKSLSLSVRTFFECLARQLDAYVKHLVRFNLPDKNGVTKKDHLLKVRKQLAKAGKTEEELDRQFAELKEPEVMPAGIMLLNKFMELSSARQSGTNGPLPISYTEMKAYAELTDTEFDPWEVETIRSMDRAFLAEVDEAQNKEKA